MTVKRAYEGSIMGVCYATINEVDQMSGQVLERKSWEVCDEREKEQGKLGTFYCGSILEEKLPREHGIRDIVQCCSNCAPLTKATVLICTLLYVHLYNLKCKLHILLNLFILLH